MALALVDYVNPAARDRLRSWLTSEDRWAHTFADFVPDVLADRLAVARALGDPALVNMTMGALAWHQAALCDRESAITLTLVDAP
jgi:hypothetical protein